MGSRSTKTLLRELEDELRKEYHKNLKVRCGPYTMYANGVWFAIEKVMALKTKLERKAPNES